MSKILRFEELLSKSELKQIEIWAISEFAPEKRNYKFMPERKKYRIVHDHDGRKVAGLLEYSDRDFARSFAQAMQKKFPHRNYRVEEINLSARERFIETVY